MEKIDAESTADLSHHMREEMEKIDANINLILTTLFLNLIVL